MVDGESATMVSGTLGPYAVWRQDISASLAAGPGTYAKPWNRQESHQRDDRACHGTAP